MPRTPQPPILESKSHKIGDKGPKIVAYRLNNDTLRGDQSDGTNDISNLRKPKKSYFIINSTSLWTKQERNMRESNLRCVFFRSPSPHICSFVPRVHGR
jgi:hypothetical protein